MTQQIPTGTTIDGRYAVLDRVGSGGMADVYSAEDSQLDRRVAVKLLYRRFASDEEFVERFRREASSAASLQHPNVVAVFDRGEWDGTYYIAMEFLEGQSLKEIVREHGALDPSWAIDVTLQVLRAADFAHSRGVIHRDLKPHNVIVDEDGRAKVTDFGIARAGASDMTETGSIMGTAQYLSPEQAQGHAVSAQSDLYSIGILLYELLAGRVPFDAESAVTIALKQVSEAPPAPSLLNPQVTPELDAVVARALQKDPTERFADAQAFIAALEAARPDPGATHTSLQPIPTPSPEPLLVAGSPPGTGTGSGQTSGRLQPVDPGEVPPTPEEVERRRRRKRALAAGMAVLAVLGLVLLAYLLTRPDQVAVPAVVGTSEAAATQALERLGFEVDARDQQDGAPEGTVVGQRPEAGRELDEGDTVVIAVSSGPGQETIPADVLGKPVAEARDQLEALGFRVDERREASETVPRGRVVRTEPEVGARYERGQEVTLVVSSGMGRVEVPDVVGDTREEATRRLEDADLRVGAVSSRADGDAAPGTVLDQGTSAGREVEPGSRVSLVLATAPDDVEAPDAPARTVAVPSVVGQSLRDATDRLQDAGFDVDISRRAVSRRSQDGDVLAQSPSSGRRRRGSTVSIVIGRFEAPDRDPTPTPTPKPDETPTPRPGTGR